MPTSYSIDEHIYRFGLWTAARAASKSLLSNKEVQTIIEKVQLREEIKQLRNQLDLNEEYYNQWFKETGDKLIVEVQKLTCLNKSNNQKLDTTWSLFDWDKYIDTINRLKFVKNGKPFWMLEEFWMKN